MTDPHRQEPVAGAGQPSAKDSFDADQTHVFQARMRKAPQWWCSFLASNSREKNRMRAELGKIRGALPLLMKPRNGGKWTTQERADLKAMLRAASTVSPYLLVWVVPGSILILPFLAWRLDARRKHRERKAAKLAK
jgi:hypothetical protein